MTGIYEQKENNQRYARRSYGVSFMLLPRTARDLLRFQVLVEIPLADEDRKQGDRSDVNNNPGDLDTKIHANVVFGVETNRQYRPREIVERHRVTVSEHSWEHLQWVGRGRDVYNDPEDKEERDHFHSEQNNHSIQCEAESKHGDPSHHPIDDETRRAEVAIERCSECEVQQRDKT